MTDQDHHHEGEDRGDAAGLVDARLIHLQLRTSASDAPGDQDRQAQHPWVLCGHARRRAAEMTVAVDEVLEVLENPEVRYPGSAGHPVGRYVAVGGRLAVVYSPESGTVVTILWRGAEGRSA